MRISIRTLQVPTRGGAGAFSPGLTRGGAPITNGQNIISGAPGTVQVAAPRPAAMRDNSWGPYRQPSSVAPDYIYPSLYTFHNNPSVGFPGAIFSDSLVPVPAGSHGRSPVVWQHKQRVGGRTTTAAIRPFTRWPTYGRKG